MFCACFILSLYSVCAKSNRFITDIYQKKNFSNEIQKAKFKFKQDTLPNKVFTVVEHLPEFPGGSKALREFLDQNVKCPQEAKRQKGKVFVSLIITDQGNVSNAEVMKGLGHEYDEEAIRVVSSLPKWKPGIQNGIPVNVKYNLIVNFNKR